MTRRFAMAAVVLAIMNGGGMLKAEPRTLARQTRSLGDGIYSSPQAARGAAYFAEHCAPCHGTDLTGTEYAPGLAAGELVARWQNRSIGDLFSLVRTTMPLNSPGGLTAQKNIDILAFILQRAGFPQGRTELSPEASFLNQIVITPTSQSTTGATVSGAQ